MKKLALGITALLVLLAAIVYFQNDKINKIREIKRGVAASEESQTAFSDKRIGEIVATAEKKQADQKEASKIVAELTRKTLINCSILADKKSCENLMRQITGDEKIILALKKLNKAGVPVIIAWWYNPDNSMVYINDYGVITIHERADIKDIKKFLGLN